MNLELKKLTRMFAALMLFSLSLQFLNFDVSAQRNFNSRTTDENSFETKFKSETSGSNFTKRR